MICFPTQYPAANAIARKFNSVITWHFEKMPCGYVCNSLLQSNEYILEKCFVRLLMNVLGLGITMHFAHNVSFFRNGFDASIESALDSFVMVCHVATCVKLMLFATIRDLNPPMLIMFNKKVNSTSRLICLLYIKHAN